MKLKVSIASRTTMQIAKLFLVASYLSISFKTESFLFPNSFLIEIKYRNSKNTYNRIYAEHQKSHPKPCVFSEKNNNLISFILHATKTDDIILQNKENQINENQKTIHKKVGIYIHIPYCRQRCKYCNFAIVSSHAYSVFSY